MFQLTDLPDTLFLEILSRLTPREIVLHRLVSRASHAALARDDLARASLHVFFPHSLECRILRSRQQQQEQKQDLAPPDVELELPDWPAIFASVSRRYHNLSSGKFHSVTTIPLLRDRKLLRPFAPWNRLLRRDGMAAPLQLRDASWTYDAGVLVYPPSSPSGTLALKAVDLCSGGETLVPFDWAAKIIRRVRLSSGVLVVEWAEAEGAHPLNERDVAHRHFATAFDVRGTSSPLLPATAGPAPEVTFRAEWKIHYLGLPLSSRDRLLSAHSATHYAAYAHQPTRSPWGEDAPLERLVVWALGEPSSYRPSLDPTSSSRPERDPGPEVVLRLANADLDHWGLRQGDAPRLMRLALDEGHVFFLEEDHLWAAGPQSSPTPPARHSVRSTGVPVSGAGPRWVDECGAEGDAERSFCPAATWHDAGAPDAAGSWPGRAPCWRHEEFPYLTVSEVVDAAAGTRVCGRRCFAMEMVSASTSLGVPSETAADRPGSDEEDADADADAGWAGRGEVQFGDDVWGTVMSGAALAGDERWVVGEDAAGDVSVVRF